MPQQNQHKPLPPLDDVGPHILKYWKMRKNDHEILNLLLTKHIDTQIHGLGLSSFKKMRKSMGLERARSQKHTLETLQGPISELRKKFPMAGACEMTSLLFHEKGMSVSRDLVVLYFRTFEKALVKQRKAGRLKRRRFWAAGVNDMVTIDQHDKWQRFGLRLHTGSDPFPGAIHWVKIWWTNRNPKLIASYHLEHIKRTGYMPLISQSDPGSENYGIANVQSVLRQWHDPSLAGTIQHCWMRQKKNVKPEITWS